MDADKVGGGGGDPTSWGLYCARGHDNPLQALVQKVFIFIILIILTNSVTVFFMYPLLHMETILTGFKYVPTKY